MPDNRRRNANTVPVVTVITCAAVGVAALAAGLFWVWCKNQLYSTGVQIRKYESELVQLRSRNEAARTSISTLTSTAALQKRFSSGFIKLVPIAGDRMVLVGSAPKPAGPGELRSVANERKPQ